MCSLGPLGGQKVPKNANFESNISKIRRKVDYTEDGRVFVTMKGCKSLKLTFHNIFESVYNCFDVFQAQKIITNCHSY